MVSHCHLKHPPLHGVVESFEIGLNCIGSFHHANFSNDILDTLNRGFCRFIVDGCRFLCSSRLLCVLNLFLEVLGKVYYSERALSRLGEVGHRI